MSDHDVHMGGGKRAERFWPSLKRLFGLLGSQRAAMSTVIALVVVSVALNVIAPKVLGVAVDVIYDGVQSGHIDFSRLGVLVLTVLGMYAASSLLMWGQGFLLNRLVMRVVYDLRARIEEKINRLPLRYFDARQRGDVMSRVTNDVDNIQAALQQGLAQLVQSGLTVIGISAMMFVVSWQLALIALIAIPLAGLVAGGVGSRAQKMFTRQWAATGDLNGHVEESFSGKELVRAFGREDDMMAEFDRRNDRLYRASFGAQFVSGAIMPSMTFISSLSYVLIAVAGGLKVAAGQLTLGDATAFIQYSREFTQPISEMAGMANMLQSGVASAERTFELLDAEEEAPDATEPDGGFRARGEVRFEDVAFRYTADRPLIEHLNLEVSPGQTVAIVGPTGAGKTTLVNLMLRFYELDGGRILLDGRDIARMPRAELRGQVGMVLQDAWLFEGTIRENIRYGRLDATDDEVVEAARASMVDRFVRQLPHGYDTVLTEEGGSLSVGERQLVTIARAFLRDPRLLILDEATSSVDTRTELLVQQAMAALRADRTSFVIAHRLSTIRDADTILVMEEGRIVEQGNHGTLIARDGAYARLYRSQFAGAVVDE